MDNKTQICSNCNGTGKGPNAMQRLGLIRNDRLKIPWTCDVCNGYGRVKRFSDDSSGGEGND